MLKYVENINIDREKWDLLIAKSVNGFVYSTSSYLDIVCNNWDTLIYGDYEIVMPLPYKKKYGVKYITHPYFAQQLGLFYLNKPKPEIINEFIVFLRNSFLYFRINLNFDNNISNINYIEKTNLILSLVGSYSAISEQFSKNTKRNIKKSKNEGFNLSINNDSKTFIKFFKSNLTEKVSDETIDILTNILNYSFKTKIGEVFSVEKNGELLASVFILKSFNRYIYLTATSSSKGKELRAMFYLVNYFIENNCNSNNILDFEGSDVEGVKRFYKGFNSQEQNYKHIYKKFF